jgi:hypothetical protein
MEELHKEKKKRTPNVSRISNLECLGLGALSINGWVASRCGSMGYVPPGNAGSEYGLV